MKSSAVAPVRLPSASNRSAALPKAHAVIEQNEKDEGFILDTRALSQAALKRSDALPVRPYK